jgi:hypothetical protein
MAFVKVKNDDFWNPTQMVGPDGKPTERTTPPTDQDFLDGWLLGYEDNQGKDKNSTLYSIMLPDNSGQKSVWGSALLNESLKKVPIGSFVRIQWMGKVKAKQAGGRPYHIWEVSYDPDKGLHSAVGGNAVNANAISTPANNAIPAASSTGLPF